MPKKSNLILVLVRNDDIEFILPRVLKFISQHLHYLNDDFDAIIVSPGVHKPKQIGRFNFLRMEVDGASFLTFVKFKNIMKHYLNVWCVDYSHLQCKSVSNLRELGYDDIVFQAGKRKGEIDAATYYGKTGAICDLLSFLEARKSYKAKEGKLIARWQKRTNSPVVEGDCGA